MRLTAKSKRFANLLARWRETDPACGFSAPGWMTLRTDVLLSAPNLMRLPIHDMAFKEGELP